MDLIITLLIGLLAGAAAKLIMPGKDPGGWILTALLGVAGSWVGKWLFGLIGMANGGAGFIGSVLGSLVLLFLYRLIAART